MNGFSQRGGVGIGTNHPQATLHVAGTFKVDSVPVRTRAKRIALIDSSGLLCAVDVDTFKTSFQSQGSGLITYYICNNTQTSTATSSMQTRVTLTLPPGTYLLFSNCDVFNSSIDAGARVQLNEGASEIAYSIAYSNTGTYGSWSDMQQVSPTVSTTYSLMWGSWPTGTTSYIRRARIAALKIQ
jgi:hypothetical protein